MHKESTKSDGMFDPMETQPLSEKQIKTLRILDTQVKQRLLVIEQMETEDTDVLFKEVHDAILEPKTLPELKTALGDLPEGYKTLVSQATQDCLTPDFEKALEIDLPLLEEIRLAIKKESE